MPSRRQTSRLLRQTSIPLRRGGTDNVFYDKFGALVRALPRGSKTLVIVMLDLSMQVRMSFMLNNGAVYISSGFKAVLRCEIYNGRRPRVDLESVRIIAPLQAGGIETVWRCSRWYRSHLLYLLAKSILWDFRPGHFYPTVYNSSSYNFVYMACMKADRLVDALSVLMTTLPSGAVFGDRIRDFVNELQAIGGVNAQHMAVKDLLEKYTDTFFNRRIPFYEIGGVITRLSQ